MFKPGELWPDTHGTPINAHGGGILFHGGTYWWFGEHKIEGEAGNRAHVGFHVYASENLVDWRDEGIALAVDDSPGSEIPGGCVMERPKVIHCPATGKFVMWFHLEPKGGGYSGARCAVAIADTPAGPYRYLHSLRPNAGVWPENVAEEDKRPLSAEEAAHLESLALGGAPFPWYPKHLCYRRDHEGGQMSRDMTLFVDDDGSAYHIHAAENNGTLHISLLADDFTTPAGRYVRVMPGRFHEAPALMKWNGRYFLFSSDCTGWSPNPTRLSVADSIWGPWEELGNPCIGNGAQMANSFESQPTFILPVPGKQDAFIYMADRWRPRNAIDGRHLWLPIVFKHGCPVIEWHDQWDLGVFDV
ncbi:glycoside hydrolase family 43 protein [Luteolibacter sp. LG18]|uniref:glycoside hydrolase family 43 protein n=1 Tax=Luteolibacter sp. LG18 TaxID=2819286 RepID=UPI002B2A9F16|nr:beta-glucanase [Luteolibacter sp. LG18]